tara:strand:- start:731 stop:1081 length:351 start_codon:yes stop_codon:yes gene_type:complete
MKQVGAYNFEEEVLKSKKLCLVYFKSRGCPLCTNLSIVIGDLFKTYFTRVKFCNVETSVEKELADIFEIEGVPTVILFSNGDGHEIDYPENPCPFSGYSADYLIEHIENFLNNDEE